MKWSHPGVLKGDKNRLNFRWSKNVDFISIHSIPLANYVIFSNFHLLNFSRRSFHSVTRPCSKLIPILPILSLLLLLLVDRVVKWV